MSGEGQKTPMQSAPVAAIRGRVRAPGDKSTSIRALILAAMAVGRTDVTGMLEAEDALSTANAMRALGAHVVRTGPGAWQIEGVGVGGFREPANPLDFGNSGTGSRLAMGAMAGSPITATFDGDASLRTRPMRRILDPLERMGLQVLHCEEGGRLPLTLRGTDALVPLDFQPQVPSAQLKSAVLLAGLAAPGETIVTEAEATRDPTEKMMRHFGAAIAVAPHGAHGRRIVLKGQPELTAAPVVVPADPSSAAFPLVAALIAPEAELVLDAVMLNPLRAGLLLTLQEMGASIEHLDARVDGGEDVADLRIRASRLRGVEVPASRAPSMIDEYPILAVAAAFAEGRTVMRGLKELRVKESDRLEATAALLRANGVSVEIDGDDLSVEGKGAVPGGGLVTTHMDHRIAMSALVMGVAAQKPVAVDDVAFIATSFPDFTGLMSRLGAQFSAL